MEFGGAVRIYVSNGSISTVLAGGEWLGFDYYTAATSRMEGYAAYSSGSGLDGGDAAKEYA